jgi:hypothetical protein
MHEIAYQKVEKLSFFLKVWWDVAHQIWWDTAHQIWRDVVCQILMKSRLARIKFDESLSSSLMSRFRRVWWVVSSSSCHFEKLELDSVRHFEKTRIEQSKHRRWDDQAWSQERIHRNTFCKKEKFEIAFFDHISHFETRRKNTLLAFSQQVASFKRNILILIFCKRRRLSKEKQFIIVMFSKRREIKIFKIIKRLFSFIIVCYSKSLNTIQSFREAKKRNRLTLKNFHHIFQDVIAARQKNLELDSDYNSSSFKLFSSVISDQFFRKSTFD